MISHYVALQMKSVFNQAPYGCYFWQRPRN